MKKYIREMIDDLRRKHGKDFIPPLPKPSSDAATTDLTPPPQPAMPNDLNNQILSKNSKEDVRQLDFQAQENEERETIG